MAIEQTLSIIKPDAVAKNIIGKIYTCLEENGLKILAAKMLHLTREQAEKFYAIHNQRPFYNDLVNYMISGPVIAQVLEGEDAVINYRNLMGATMPNDAEPGTIRYDFARDNPPGENAVHGSDSVENARMEIDFFFKPDEICARTR